MNAFQDLKSRGLVENFSHPEVEQLIDKGGLTFYIGFDPTAESMQLGNMFQVINMMRLQKAGHRPIAVVGGATGMVGDPSGKSAERNLLDKETLDRNVSGMKRQLEQFLDFKDKKTGAILLNNLDWIGEFNLIDFLRDVGKRFRLSEMLAKDSVKSRLNSDAGISFTEFTYQMMQAYDFAYLAKNHNCTLQLGGGDQWGNITAGIDLSRKLHSIQTYALVTPLVTDSQGRKFGKSEGGAVYIDSSMTSPYLMYQYLLNIEDESVIRFLKYFSFKPLDEISALESSVEEEPHLRKAQKALAEELVELIHGPEGLVKTQQATRIFFGDKIQNLKDKELKEIFSDVPSVQFKRSELDSGLTLLDALEKSPLFKSRGEAKRALGQKGVYLNNDPIEGNPNLTSDSLASETCLVVRKGKKNYCLVVFEKS